MNTWFAKETRRDGTTSVVFFHPNKVSFRRHNIVEYNALPLGGKHTVPDLVGDFLFPTCAPFYPGLRVYI